MKKLILYTLILLLMSCRSTQEVDTSVYMDAKQPVDKRVEALLAQMTLEEKVGQMDMVTVWDKEAIFKNGYYDFGAWLAITAPGFCLNKIVGLLKERTKAYSLLSIALGLLLIWIAPLEWLIIPGCLLVGLGYGVIQPMLYEKTTHAALPQKATMALAFVMMMNYLAILLYPFIGDFLQWVFHTQSQEFPFIFNLLITVGTFFWAYRCRDTFLFNDQLK